MRFWVGKGLRQLVANLPCDSLGLPFLNIAPMLSRGKSRLSSGEFDCGMKTKDDPAVNEEHSKKIWQNSQLRLLEKLTKLENLALTITIA